MKATYLLLILAAVWSTVSSANGEEKKSQRSVRAARGEDSAAALLVPPRSGLKGQAVRADFDKKERAWLERVAFVPFRERAQGKPWETDATSFVAAALDAWWPRSAYEFDEELAACGQKLKAQCDDPLVRYLAARTEYFCTYDHFWHWLGQADFSGLARSEVEVFVRESEAALAILRGSGAPPALLRLIATHAAVCAYEANTPERAESLYRERAAMTREAIAEGGGYDLPADEEVLVAHFLREPYGKRAGDYVADLRGDVEKAPLSEWARLTMLGICDWADRVRAGSEKREAAAETLRVQRDAKWQKAWELRPDKPEIPATTFRGAAGGDMPDGTPAREWFDRAIAAEFDHREAYNSMFKALGWGNAYLTNIDGEMRFARGCVASGRFDTAVPFALPDALKAAVNMKPWRPIARESATASALVRLGDGVLADPSRAAQSQRWQSLRAVWAWLGGEDKIAAQALAAVPESKLHRAALYELQVFGSTPSEMIAEVAVRSSKARADYDRAEQLYEKGTLRAADDAFSAALAKAPKDGPAGAWLTARRALAELEIELAKGDWVKVPPTLTLWSPRAGRWSASEAGALVLEGDGRPAVIRFRARVSLSCEWRGEYSFGGAPSAGSSDLGVAFRAGINTFFLQCRTQENDGNVLFNAMRWGFYDIRLEKRFPEKPPDVSVPRAASNRFFLRTTEERITFELNGQPVFPNVFCAVRHPSPIMQVGFASQNCPTGRTITIRNLELRQLAPPAATPGDEER